MLKHAFCALALSALVAPVFPAIASSNAELQAAVDVIATKARPGILGILVTDADGKTLAHVNDHRAYMMMSAFKSPIAAAALARVDAGTLSLTRTVHLTPADVVGGSGVPSLGDRLTKGPLDVTVEELLRTSVTESDNTAVDALLRVLGGGAPVTAWLEGKGIHGMRVDVGEGEFGRLFKGLKPGQAVPAAETDAQEEARLKRGYAMALASEQNTTTLAAAATYLQKLEAGDLLSAASTQRLLGLMKAQVIPNRLRAGLPTGFTIADKTGTGASNGNRISAYNDMAIITAPDGTHLQVAAFLRDAPMPGKDRDALYAELGRTLARYMTP